MVAKSYQQCELIGDPFTENGRQYIYIKRNGKERKVVNSTYNYIIL